MATYDRFAGVDDNYLFPPEVRSAIVNYPEVQDKLNDKSDTSHKHEINGVNGLQDALNDKSDTSHKHEINGVNGLQDALASLGYNSGRRDITSLAGGKVAGGKIYLQRVANQVFLDLELVEPSSTMGNGSEFIKIPLGFRRQTRLDTYLPYGVSNGTPLIRSMFLFTSGGLGVWTPHTSDRYRINLTWITKDAVPATPPGDPS